MEESDREILCQTSRTFQEEITPLINQATELDTQRPISSEQLTEFAQLLEEELDELSHDIEETPVKGEGDRKTKHRKLKTSHQIPRIINQKIAQKLIEKISMTDIAHQLSISTSTVIRKLNDFRFKHDFSRLPEIMSWDEYAFTKGKMSFIAQDFKKLNIITVLEGRTQAIIRNRFLKYDRSVRCRVKIMTMDMFSPYYDLTKQLRFRISRLRLKQSTGLFYSNI